MTFRALSGDSPDTLTTVARFLALLDLFREGAVALDQVTPLGELTVRWTGSEDGEVEITDEFDGGVPEPLEDATADQSVTDSAEPSPTAGHAGESANQGTGQREDGT
jgi:segregation and condensation protein A